MPLFYKRWNLIGFIFLPCVFSPLDGAKSHTQSMKMPNPKPPFHNPNLLIFMHKYKMGNSPPIYIFKWNTLYTHYLPICPYMIQMEYSSIVNWYVSAFTYRELYEVLFAWMGPGALECSLRSFLIENTVVSFQSYIFRLAASSSICLLCPWHWCSAYLILHSPLHVATAKLSPLLSRVTQHAKFAGSRIKVKNPGRSKDRDNKGQVKELRILWSFFILIVFQYRFNVIYDRFSVLLQPGVGWAVVKVWGARFTFTDQDWLNATYVMVS